jgi:hypothetical protein
VFPAGEHNGTIRMHTLNGLYRLGHGCCFHNLVRPNAEGAASAVPFDPLVIQYFRQRPSWPRLTIATLNLPM